jgi:LPPG:FO 2-phospho-L-lactate transferase
MRITVLSGGVGGARFLLGLRAICSPDDHVTVIGNTADDITLAGLRVCPDLDTVMYTLGDGIDAERGWGRRDESWHAMAELAEYDDPSAWFALGDRDLATHLVRTRLLAAGVPLSEVTRRLCARWRLGVDLLPMTDDPVESHVVIDAPDDGSGAAAPGQPEGEPGRRTVHFQEYWVRLQAPKAYLVTAVGADRARPAPGVLAAIADADVLLLPPSNPVVSIGTILAVPGIRTAIQRSRAAVVGVAPIISGAPVRGMADRLLPTIGVEVSAGAVGAHYGARSAGGILDGWLVDDADRSDLAPLRALGLRAAAMPLLMTDPASTAAIATAAIELARSAGAAAP